MQFLYQQKDCKIKNVFSFVYVLHEFCKYSTVNMMLNFVNTVL